MLAHSVTPAPVGLLTRVRSGIVDQRGRDRLDCFQLASPLLYAF